MRKNFVFILFFSTFIVKMSIGQSSTLLQSGDSLYAKKNWAGAKMKYDTYLKTDDSNSLVWNRLGFCNQNLGNFREARADYDKSLNRNPSPPVKTVAMLRMAQVYSLMNQKENASSWLVRVTSLGYNSLNDLDSLPAFENLRMSSGFQSIRKQIYETVYPCSRNPRNHDFDFWIGDWTCYRNGTETLSGYSHIESMAGGCAILENYSSTQAYTGKSFNYYDTVSGKWKQDWIGSGGPSDRQHYDQGEFADGKMNFTYEITNASGEKTKGNFIFYFISSDSVRQYQDVVDVKGKTVSVTYDLIYIRRK
jgi:tetratricopeptide (TPR) repeat protein